MGMQSATVSVGLPVIYFFIINFVKDSVIGPVNVLPIIPKKLTNKYTKTLGIFN